MKSRRVVAMTLMHHSLPQPSALRGDDARVDLAAGGRHSAALAGVSDGDWLAHPRSVRIAGLRSLVISIEIAPHTTNLCVASFVPSPMRQCKICKTGQIHRGCCSSHRFGKIFSASSAR
jgi:hypothetical protein